MHKHILAKKDHFNPNNDLSLYDHLCHVRDATVAFAKYLGMDENIAAMGAVLHDIGKAHPEFQRRLNTPNGSLVSIPHRHEITSLLFLGVIPKIYQEEVIEMVVAHHKSTLGDKRLMGLLDLDYDRDDIFELHSANWDDWSQTAIDILEALNMKPRYISIEDARDSYEQIIDYCTTVGNGYSKWKGLLIGGDHLASSLSYNLQKVLPNLFGKPQTSFYNRQHELYPLSLIAASSSKKHTLVTAPTGAGKTDYLIRRCKNRIFYILPFQASINAMYDRLIDDVGHTTKFGIRKQHGASRGQVDDYLSTVLQKQIGSSIKVLTPHQICSIVFASVGFETTLLDIQGCDVIFDEIHVYSDETKQLVMKLIEVLLHQDCRIHLGTATMPSVMYSNILSKLKQEDVLEVSLPSEVLETFNRHVLYKMSDNNIDPILQKAIDNDEKILIVSNRISNAQQLYLEVSTKFPQVQIMLIHSKFKRRDRFSLEDKLTSKFNTSNKACIVISTQVVEVSLDISFDVMITEVAPLDAMIQRFGRINRKRTKETVANKQTKPIYLLPLPNDAKAAMPYELETLLKSYEVIDDGKVFEESKLQTKLDYVFDDFEINNPSQVFKFRSGKYRVKRLTHMPKSVIHDFLGVDGVRSVVECDIVEFEKGNSTIKSSLEVTIGSWLVKKYNLEELDSSKGVYIIPNEMYSETLGLIT